MDLKVIENILNLISESDVNEVSIEEGNFKIKVKKKPDEIKQEAGAAPQQVYLPPQQGIQAPQQGQQPAPAAPQPAPAGGESSSAEPAGSANTHTITSPIVGTFYEAPSPDSDAYVAVGDTISKGQTLCIVEAMKIMNEVEAEVSGKIVKKLVDDGQPVEYEQPLYEVELS